MQQRGILPFSLIRYLRRLSISQKFYFIICVVALVFALQLLAFKFAMNTVSSIRAYVGGEGLWSKAQKESVNNLLQYSTSLSESDYDSFLRNLSIPLGDRIARLELEKSSPNTAVARQGFIQGGNNPADIDGMIFLFKHFKGVSYLKNAIAVWTQGDTHIEEQLNIGKRMHAIVEVGGNTAAVQTSLKPLVEEALKNDATLTVLENRFSETLGEGSRIVGTVLFYTILIFAMILSLSAFMVALYFSKLITQVDWAKSEFVALASHQLRSPLHVIALSIEGLKSIAPPRSVEEKSAVEGISREVEQMTSLMNMLLSVSRIELGSLIVEPHPIDIMAFARGEMNSLKILAHTKGITVRETYVPNSLTFSTDPTLMQIIFQNLLSNAIKYTPAGGEIALAVVLFQSRIVITVSDTGLGIPKNQQENIFKKLFRASNAHATDKQGTGLGLYIVKSVVTEAGGDIWFASTEGEGTEFTVTFPVSGMKEASGTVRL